MTQRGNPMAVVVLAMALGAASPMVLLAAEHGGTTLGGGKEHGGTAVSQEGSHGMVTDEAAVLREAAAALRAGQARPDLAAQLEKLAKAHASK